MKKDIITFSVKNTSKNEKFTKSWPLCFESYFWTIPTILSMNDFELIKDYNENDKKEIFLYFLKELNNFYFDWYKDLDIGKVKEFRIDKIVAEFSINEVEFED